MRGRKSYLLLVFLIVSLCFPSVSFAKVETITHTVRQPFGGSQSPDDARVAAMHKAKREALEKAGVYIESLTVVKDSVVEKDEILALAAGVLKAEIISQKNYLVGEAFGIEVVAKVDVDTSILEERVKRLLQDRTLLEKHRESRQREGELLAKLERLEVEVRSLQTLSAERQEQKKKELKEQFLNTTQALTAVEWRQKALALWKDGKYTDPKEAIGHLDQAIRLDPKDARAYTSRGIAYRNLGWYERAIDDYDQAIRLDSKYARAYNNRGIAYKTLGQYERAIQDHDQAIRLNSEYAPAYVNRGSAYYRSDNLARACRDWQKACDLGNCDGVTFARKKGLCQ
jgi:tetratricopeptide (TPR) repeat protein